MTWSVLRAFKWRQIYRVIKKSLCTWRLVFGLECRVSTYSDPVFSRMLSTPNDTVTLLCIPSLCNWKKMELTRPAFSRNALRLIQRICLWHSWRTCLRTESFIKLFGLQDLRIFLRPIFSLGCDDKLCVFEQSPHSWWPSQNIFGMCTVLYWTRSSKTHFGVSINVWRLEEDILNTTCSFLYCNHQVRRDFLITLYK